MRSFTQNENCPVLQKLSFSNLNPLSNIDRTQAKSLKTSKVTILFPIIFSLQAAEGLNYNQKVTAHLVVHSRHLLVEVLRRSSLMVAEHSDSSIRSIVREHLRRDLVVVGCKNGRSSQIGKSALPTAFTHDQSAPSAVPAGCGRRCMYGRLWPSVLPSVS